jgi:hypothetical protein
MIMDNPRQQLDNLFAFDAAFSVMFGTLALLAPHGLVSKLAGGYNHSVHETLRYVILEGMLLVARGSLYSKRLDSQFHLLF